MNKYRIEKECPRGVSVYREADGVWLMTGSPEEAQRYIAMAVAQAGSEDEAALPCCGEPVPRLDTPTGETDCVSCGASFASLLDAHHWEATFRPKDC